MDATDGSTRPNSIPAHINLGKIGDVAEKPLPAPVVFFILPLQVLSKSQSELSVNCLRHQLKNDGRVRVCIGQRNCCDAAGLGPTI